MAKKEIALIITHGLNSVPRTTLLKFETAIKNKLGPYADRVSIVPLVWNSYGDHKQEEWHRALNKSDKDLNFKFWRKYLFNILTDAMAYLGNSYYKRGERFYKGVQDSCDSAVKRAERETVQGAPLLMLGVSMGCTVISDYIWDVQQSQDRYTPFRNLKTLNGVFFLGNNNPIFTSQVPVVNMKPIKVPSTLINDYAPAFWYNIYNKNDILAFPQSNLNQAYQNSILEDVEMRVGNLFQCWNPLSHSAYYTDPKVINLISKKIKEHLR